MSAEPTLNEESILSGASHPNGAAPSNGAVLVEAAQFVLETMFFAESEPVPAPEPPQPDPVVSKISFEGGKRGWLIIGIPEPCARAMAAGFEGIPDESAVPESSIAQVVLELANMICGATLARLYPHGLFRLHSPELSSPDSNPPRGAQDCSAACESWLQIPYMDGAILHLALSLEEQP